MDDNKRVNTIAALSVIALIIIIIVSRILLKLSSAFFLICGAGVAVILAILVCVLVISIYKRRSRKLETQSENHEELRIEYSFLRKVAGVPTKFRYKELEEATDGFMSLVGKGSSASVFKGILSDGTSVAVKRIDSEEKRGEKEFRSEVAAIASVHHVNLVRLLGYCNAPSAPKYLVYEYIPNGSLDCWIFPKRESQRRHGGCLSWNLRYKEFDSFSINTYNMSF